MRVSLASMFMPHTRVLERLFLILVSTVLLLSRSSPRCWPVVRSLVVCIPLGSSTVSVVSTVSCEVLHV